MEKERGSMRTYLARSEGKTASRYGKPGKTFPMGFLCLVISHSDAP